MIRFRSYKTRLRSALLLLGLGAVALTGWEASVGATQALRAATYDRLTALRETKRRQIERYFEDLGNHVLALSSDESAIEALERFAASKPSLPVTSVDREALRRKYDELFREVLARAPHTRESLQAWFPQDPLTLALQHLFIARNPHPAGSRWLQLTAEEAGPYGDVHARFHPTLHRYLSAFHFYDIFLIDGRDGRILYTVAKEVDLGTRLSEAPYSGTTLAAAYRRAFALPEPESFVIEDYAPYLPSSLAPAAFVAAPVYRAGSKIGVLAIQLSIADINGIMTGNGRWSEEGLGRTGQTYLVGSDGTLRSDLRQELEQSDRFLSRLQDAGIAPELVDRIRSYRTAVLNLRVGVSGVAAETGPATDFRGVRVLRSHAPVRIPGLTWTAVAEIEADEALAPVRALQWRVFWQAVAVAVALVVSAHLLAERVTRPVLRLAESARRLGQRDFRVRSQVESDDEVGRLAEAFNSMAEDLERTTVSKHELDRILASLINAVFVVDTKPEASVNALFDSPLRQTNRAAQELLGPADGMRLRDIIPAGERQEWHDRIGRLLTAAHIGPEQTSVRTRDSSEVPVLFSASWLAEDAATRPGLVCVAQNIAEWKAAQDELRRMSKVFMDATDPIVVTDARGSIAYCNSEAERAYGWPSVELRGRDLAVLFPEDRREALTGLVERCFAGEAVRNVETVQQDRGGRRIPALVTLSLLTGPDGSVAGLAAIAKDITERKQAEEALQVLTGRLIDAHEEERRRIARELHDDLTQRLAAVAIEAGRLERMPRDDDRWRAVLDRIKRQMAELSDEVHGLSRRLHPSTLDDLGLIAAIESECRAFFERGNPPVEFTHDDALPPLPKDAQLGLYRIVQEALRNIQKHAAADEVSIVLGAADGRVYLTIRDNGRGFDAASTRGSGIGLAGMEERARLLGASFRLRSSPAGGTTIEVAMPYEQAENTARG